MLIPHLHFCGNCQAIALYVKAFNTKTSVLFHNGSGDGEVVHVEMHIHGSRAMLNDRFGAKERTDEFAIALVVTFDNAEALLACYDTLKDGSIIIDPFEQVPYSKLCGLSIDKLEVHWGFMLEKTNI
jgi:uncharacterized glyoxalase superfamily protein PhnB